MKQFACTEGTFSFIKHRNVFRKGPHGTNHTASIIVAASNSGVSKLHLSPLNANIKTFLQQSNIPRSSIFFPHKIKRTRNLAKSTVSGDGHGSASACPGPGASRWAQTALTLPPKCPGGGFCFPLPSCEVRADPDGEDHRSVTEAGSESGGRKQRGREFRQEEQRGGSQVGSASCLSIPSSASRPQHPPRVLRGGQVAEQPGWEQGKPCGMPGAGRHRAVVHGQEAEVTTEESASFGKVPYVLRAFKTSSLLFRMGGEV